MAPSCAFREAPCHGSVETETDRQFTQSVQSPQRFINPVPTRESLAQLRRSRSGRLSGWCSGADPNLERSLPDATHGNGHLLLALGSTIERLTAFAEVIERCGDRIVFGYRPVDSVCLQPVVLSINGAIATQHGIEA